ncbi:MAG: c-type cytochrome [Bdellovibrionales bacterium]|nr:c-type cytochrome [Bdellovibrionales bacterium]
MAHDHKHDDKKHGHHHYVLPNSLAFKVFGALIFLTIITVWTAHFDFGAFNFPLAMFIATIKALLVCMIFMNLKNDVKENSVIFFTSFLFLAIFIVLTGSDIFFRGDVYVKGPLVAGASKSKFKKPWVSTAELVAHGKELFGQQCTSCHGAEGLGNGPAAAALVPPPRNFAQNAGWKNGYKPSQIFKTLKEGIKGSSMASFATLPAEDRWALAHYVVSINPAHAKDTTSDLAAVGVDPSKDGMGGESSSPTIPVSVAMAKLAVADINVAVASSVAKNPDAPVGSGAAYYQSKCVGCHGVSGEGALVRNMGVSPKAYLKTGSLSGVPFDRFKSVVTKGLPGDVMPGYGNLSNAQLQDLYNYVKSAR